ncbi:MAG: hypothetical protein DWQ34_14825 [Planctomycetota bacterium]|nr:MAG: hypothetical protein DWQ29_17300 [Planctomycetota bacterium]REJ91551.1 MAG: hypothetical protein DWQ34_14825 [Planctomycetota bacterium]REK20516.1 MAG: hypothetical protein DWQ41_24810 [Planctomycetota bacterium]REK28270.1 MAG: hypothetical protein DWQ45_24720 [Planctomycetota bacterium]
MSVTLFIAAALSLLVAGEAVAGAAFFPRAYSIMDPVMDSGLRSFNPELFVYRDEHPTSFWVLVTIHSFLVSLFWLICWWSWN